MGWVRVVLRFFNVVLLAFVFALLSAPLQTSAHEKPNAKVAEAGDDPEAEPIYWIRIPAKNKYDRSLIEELGLHIEGHTDEYVTAYGTQKHLYRLEKLGRVDLKYEIDEDAATAQPGPNKAFPGSDANFHDYPETVAEMQRLANENPSIVALESLGRTFQGRDIYNIRLSVDPATSSTKPAIVFMGAHHAREHLSSEVPLRLATYLVDRYRAGDARIVRILQGREIHIIPVVNPDGKEWDIGGTRYRSWRKNRRPVGSGATGVDLNRNYGFGWGGPGASADPSDDTYRGPSAFSEPETQAIKAFIERQQNISILLSYHTFSELILYPWGDRFEQIPIERDRRVHEVMAQTMARWNGYTPMQSADLYRAAGDTCDWAYAEHRIFSFTFEMDPKSMWNGGFYPGQSVIDTVFQKNLEPVLYLMEFSDNPYRVLNPAGTLGLSSWAGAN